jgi:hypothetical protein
MVSRKNFGRRLGPRQWETLLDGLRLAAEVRDDEADRLDGYGYRAEATEQRQGAVKLRELMAKLDGTAEATDSE